jgi:gliding motility-associated-like protein
MTPINHSTTGATGIGAPSGLPPGVTASFSSGTITISGTPTASGNFNYSIPLTGGCGSVNATGTIMVNSLPTVGINSTPGTTVCSGTSVTLSGTGASSYSWSGGITNGVAFVPSSTQTYTVTGTNANGCTNTSSVTITVNPLPTVGINTTPGTTVCSGTSVTLSGTGATSYSWSGGITNGVAFVPSGTQTYTVTGTNANGCTNTSSVTITVNPLPTVGINVSPNTTVCSGTSVTLSGTGATSYSWSGGITNGVAFVPSSTQTYTVTGTNANGCTNTSSVTISITNSNTVTGPGSSTVCIGNAMTSITHNTTGATGIGTPTGLPSGVSASFSGGIITISGTPTVVGIYNYTIPLTGGCGSVNATGTITVNSLPTIGTNSSPGTTVCSGTSVTLSGTGATSYSWSGGVSDGVSFVPSSTQTYTVTGTDVNGCTNTNSVTITVNSLPNVGYNVSPNTSVCSGTSVTLSGTGASNYSWSGGVVDGSPFVPTSTQTYTVTGTDGNGCSNTSTVTITVNTLPTVNINASPGSTICFGDPVILSATGSGTSYTWSGGISDGQPFTPTASDVYTVTASDANGCTNTTSISLVVNPLPTITAGTNSPVCIGSDIQLNASSSSGVSCAWTGPNSFNSSFCDDIISSADETLHEGNYTIVVTDINTSCTNSQTFFVDVVNTISSAIDPVSPVCQNEGVIQLTAANLGGVWSGTGTNSIGQFDPAAAGTGTHTITYTISGTCGSSSSIDISVLEAPTAIASYNGPVCENDSLIMMGNTPSYSGNYIVQWFKSNNLISNQAGDTLLNASTTLNGVYWYFIQYDNGCKDSSSVNVIITPRPAITDAIVTNASCYNSNDGSIDIQVNSSEAYNVTWSNGAATDDINNLSSGTYTVTVNVNGACTASAIYQINSPEQLDLYLKSLSQPTCGLNNGKIELSVSGGTIPYSFTWQPNVSMDSSANQLSTGQYFVSVTDANGCNDTLSVNLDCIPDSLIIPQLVTPNNDGKNDVWEVDLTNYPNNVVKIFNRWGNVVYAANPYLPSNYWDGKVGQGVMMSLGSEYLPVGTYYFVIDLFGDGSKIYKGYIELQY